MIRILSLLIVIQFFAVSSLQAGELTAPSNKTVEKAENYLVQKDYRQAAHYLCGVLLTEYPNLDQGLLTALSDTYSRAGAVHRLKELTRLMSERAKDAKAKAEIRNLLYREITATEPSLSIIEEKNGDLIVKHERKRQSRFSFPNEGSEMVSKKSVKYQEALQRYWWFKPRTVGK